MDSVLRALRLRRPAGDERCMVCQRRLTPGDSQLAVRGMRVHADCAGYRMRAAAQAERGRLPRR